MCMCLVCPCRQYIQYMCMCVFHIIYKMCVCQYEEVHMQSGRGKRGKSVFTAALLSMSLTLKCN